MATQLSDGPASRSDQSHSSQSSSFASRPQKRSDGKWVIPLIVLVTVGGLIAVGVMLLPGMLSAGPQAKFLTTVVERRDMMITITEDGNMESASNRDVKCEVAGGSTILWIIEEGTIVKKGEELVRLDDSAIEEQINTQKITFQKARSVMIQAEKDHESAKIAVKEYIEGTFHQELQVIEGNITIAKENLNSSKNSLSHKQRMFRKGYIGQLELKSQEFAVDRAQLDVDVSLTAKYVLEKFSKPKMIVDLESARDTSEARMLAEKAAFELEEGRLNRLTAQRSKCVILAPQDGMVIYAQSNDRRSQEAGIDEGVMVRESQTLIQLPDLEQMQVKVAVHESKVEQVKMGMPANIRIQERRFQGNVVSIRNQPERTNWFGGDAKKYATIVHVDGSANLKPGMTAEVEILVENLKDVIVVPVAAVVERQGKYYCWVMPEPGKEQRRELNIGSTNDKFIVIEDGADGVAEGETIILNPKTLIPESWSREGAIEDSEEVSSFGAAKPQGDAPRANGKAAGRPGQGKPGGAKPTRPRGGSAASMIDRLDTDKDGKISKAEAPDRMKGAFDAIDKNKDGFIDASEMTGARPQGGGKGQPSADGA